MGSRGKDCLQPWYPSILCIIGFILFQQTRIDRTNISTILEYGMRKAMICFGSLNFEGRWMILVSRVPRLLLLTQAVGVSFTNSVMAL